MVPQRVEKNPRFNKFKITAQTTWSQWGIKTVQQIFVHAFVLEVLLSAAPKVPTFWLRGTLNHKGNQFPVIEPH